MCLGPTGRIEHDRRRLFHHQEARRSSETGMGADVPAQPGLERMQQLVTMVQQTGRFPPGTQRARLADDLRVNERDGFCSALLHDRETPCPLPSLVISRGNLMANPGPDFFLEAVMEAHQFSQDPGESFILHNMAVVVFLTLFAQVVQHRLLRWKFKGSYVVLGHFFPIR